VVSAFLAVAKALILQTDLLVRLDCPVSFFGVTGPVMANGMRVKCIVRAVNVEAAKADLESGCTIKPISEEQARAFFKRYGDSTKVSA
jgi:hypothetical protein